MDFILSIDHSIFRFINTSLKNDLFDAFFPFITDITKNPIFAIILILSIATIAYKDLKWKGIGIFFLAFIGIHFVDLSVIEIKEYFARPRPNFANLSFEVFLPGKNETSYSLPSGHATLAGFVWCYFSFFFRKLLIPLSILMILTVLSRVYIGLHFPSDVTLGFIYGSLMALIYLAPINKFILRKSHES